MNRTRIRSAAMAAILWSALGVPGSVGGDEPEPVPGPVGTVPPLFTADDFLLLPLRVHILSAPDCPELDARITERDIHRIVRKANAVWQAAGVRWRLESIVREEAADPEKFTLVQSLNPEGWKHYLDLRPESTRDPALLHVYFVRQMNVNGVYLGNGIAFVKDTARLRPVEGGIDEPIPRVMSHELGHALGLPHRQDRTNLMASGTTGTSFNAAEVHRARQHAKKLESAAAAAIIARSAQEHYEAGRFTDALVLDAELIRLPGPSSLTDEAWARWVAVAQFSPGVPRFELPIHGSR